MKFLIVDDFARMRRIITKVLNDLGYTRITEAEDSAAVLKLLQEGDFDFLITDWDMPGMGGLQLLKAIRANPRLAGLPVLMLTAEAKRDQILAAVKAGVSGYVLKPFNPDVLKKRLVKIFSEATDDAIAS